MRQLRPLAAPVVVLCLAISLILGVSGPAGADLAPDAAPRPGRAFQDPGYRDGQRIGGGGAAEPASTAGTVTFFVSSAAVVGVIACGIVIGGRRRRRRTAAGTPSTQNDHKSQEPPAP